MATTKPIFTPDTFKFFRDLGRNNKKVWMDANRDLYQQCVVQPFRQLLEELAPAVLRLDASFDASGRSGANFSRINRDIRFAKDKTPYRTQMYLKFSPPFPGDSETGELYTGLAADAVTAGFRIYSGSKRKESALGLVAEPHVLAKPKWMAQQKKRLGRRYESYWYSMEKGEWTKHQGWPLAPEEWKKLKGWVVRRKFAPSAATRPKFVADISRLFCEVHPLFEFVCSPSWNS